MMRNIFFPLFCLLSVHLMAQDELYPPAIEISDPTLSKFLTELTLAVGKKDKDFILSHMDPNVLSSFGGNGGIDELKEYWDFEKEHTTFWDELENILLIGGAKYEDGSGSYSIPYTFSDWPNEFDAFEHYLILGTHVNVRSAPSTENSKVLGQLSYRIVKLNQSPQDNSESESQWFNISTIDGKLTGYVHGKYLVSPVGYRMVLTKSTKGWVISSFVAGD
ncbi:SH3 domain-containing protein [Flagellimonas sp.]|uniref:SH3 domain-containing protein n=1 Tax=Flagellimonas sp. TaxID=2058762 RepID=UPI003AB3F621